MGFLKKSGDIAVSGVDTAYSSAKLKTGLVGVQVRIMPSTTQMPDDIIYIDQVKLQDTTTGKVETVKAEVVDKDVKPKKAKSKDSTKDSSKDTDKKPVKKKPVKKKESEDVEKSE